MEKNKLRDFLKKVQALSMELDEEERNEGATAALSAQTTEGSVGGTAVNENATGDNYENYDDLNSGADQEENPIYGTKSGIIVEGVEFPNVTDLPQDKEYFIANRRANDSYVLQGAILTKKYPLFVFIDFEKLLAKSDLLAEEVKAHKISLALRSFQFGFTDGTYNLYSMKTGELIESNKSDLVIDIFDIYVRTGNASFVMIADDELEMNFLPGRFNFRYEFEVESARIKDLQIKTAPKKREYKTGEYFDRNGMKVVATSLTGEATVVEDYTVIPSGPLSADDTFIIVKYKNKSTKINILVREWDGLTKPFDSKNMKELPFGGGAAAYLDLNTGTAVTKFTAFKGDDLSVPLDVSFYHVKESNTSPRNVWRMNLQRKLKVSSEDNDNNTVFTYIDEFGEEHEFTETYYYEETYGKFFVEKRFVTVDINGKLTYHEREVKKRQTCNGFTLIPKIDDFKDSELIEQRQSEQAELEEFLKTYEPTLRSYVRMNIKTNEIEDRSLIVGKNLYISFFNGVSSGSDIVILTESQAEQLKVAFNEIKGEDKYDKLSPLEKLIIKQARENLELLIDTANKYRSKKAQLDALLLQLPVNYLQDENGIISGFNGEGNLVCVFDRFGNSVAVEYDKKNYIRALHDNNGKVINFNIDYWGAIQSICDNRGREVKFYYNNSLVKVKTADGTELEFTYDYPFLKEVTVNQIRSYKYNYQLRKLVKITDVSKVSEIKKDMDDGTAENNLISEMEIAYPTDRAVLTFKDGTKEEYKFYSSGRLRKREVTDGAGFVTVNEYVYNENAETKQISVTEKVTGTAVKNSYITRVYDEFDKIISEEKDWQPLSNETVTKYITNYVYDYDDRLVEEITVTTYKTNTENGYKDTNYESHVKYCYGADGNLVKVESWVVGEEKTHGKTIEERVYDENGNVVKTVKWNTLDSSTKFYSECDRADNGKVVADRDETGEVSAEYSYLNGTNVVSEVKYANGSKFAYGKDPYDFKTTAITQSTADGEPNTTDIVYEHGLPVQVKSGNTFLDYIYDYKGNVKRVDVNGQAQFINDKRDDEYRLSDDGNTVHFGTVETVIGATPVFLKKTETLGVKDKATRLFKTVENGYIDGELVLKKEYDIKNRLVKVTDGATVTEYEYDGFDRLTKVRTANGTYVIQSDVYTYDNCGVLIRSQNVASRWGNYIYEYDTDAARTLNSIKIGTVVIKPQRDLYGRNTGKEIFKNDEKISGEYITYRKVGDHATNMPCTVWYGSGSNIKESLKYSYDNMGNIHTVVVNGDRSVRYTYDSLNRLVREDNKAFNKTVKFSYDTNGNILSRCEYAYTLKSDEELSELNCAHFDYSYDGDKLVSYNGESCAYDKFNTPTIYRGKAVEWQYGKRLINYDGVTFGYDNSGRRLTKNNINYMYDSDGRVIKQSDGLSFWYDTAGVTGFITSKGYYFYRKDIQGNIIAIIDSSGAVVVRYEYDAWGNHKIIGDEVLGNLNPFRYRGYYYDTETGLYYLQTRYYDPITGRFISQDGVEYADPESINDLNLYAYCGNNPVMYVDPTGTIALTALLIGLIIGAIVGAAVGGAVAYKVASDNGATGWELFGWTLLGIFGGAVIGGAIGAAVGAAAPAIGSFLGSSFTLGGFAFAGGQAAAVTVTGAQIAAGGAALAAGLTVLFSKWKPGSWPGDDPSISPGDGFEWRGPSEPGGKYGDWYNPETGDALHPDLNHPLPKGPHWGWRRFRKFIKDIFKII